MTTSSSQNWNLLREYKINLDDNLMQSVFLFKWHIRGRIHHLYCDSLSMCFCAVRFPGMCSQFLFLCQRIPLYHIKCPFAVMIPTYAFVSKPPPNLHRAGHKGICTRKLPQTHVNTECPTIFFYYTFSHRNFLCSYLFSWVLCTICCKVSGGRKTI